MNTGVITSRYAKALLRYVQETGRGEQVCTQVQALLNDPESISSMTLEPEIQKFISLLVEKGRMEHVRQIFRTFVRMYYESIGTRVARLTTVKPAPEIERKLHDLLEEQVGGRVILETSTDAGLIGGFVLEIDDKMLDASVRSRIEAVRRQFIISTNRIV